MAGLAQAIVQSIEACQEVYQPALFQSIRLAGGLCHLTGLKERLLEELQTLVPCEYSVDVSKSERPREQAWLGASALSQNSPQVWSVSCSAWETSGKKKVWQQFVDSGQLV